LRLVANAVAAAGATDSTATIATARLDEARVRRILSDAGGARAAANAARTGYAHKGHIRGVAWAEALCDDK
jgi:anti-sigma regulatory factor (Ser/Thr protein kinase)